MPFPVDEKYILQVEQKFRRVRRRGAKSTSQRLNPMKCKCGYDFAAHAMESPCPHLSYAIIDDSHYAETIRREHRLIESRTRQSGQMDALAEASQYVGVMLKCPICNCLLVVYPQAYSPHDGPEVYSPELP